MFTVDYTIGNLVAEGVADGEVKESVTLETTGDVAAIRVRADRSEIAADGEDLSYITIECVDEKGHVVPIADNELTISIDGPMELLALGNADIKDNDPYYDNKHKAWEGRALAVVRNNGNTGTATVKVKARTASGVDISNEIRIDSAGEK